MVTVKVDAIGFIVVPDNIKNDDKIFEYAEKHSEKFELVEMFNLEIIEKDD